MSAPRVLNRKKPCGPEALKTLFLYIFFSFVIFSHLILVRECHKKAKVVSACGRSAHSRVMNKCTMQFIVILPRRILQEVCFRAAAISNFGYLDTAAGELSTGPQGVTCLVKRCFTRLVLKPVTQPLLLKNSSFTIEAVNKNC